MEQQIFLPELHEKISAWKSDVDFVRQDVKILRHRLTEIIHQNTHRDVLALAEQFQNQFIRQLEVADEMFHDLKQADKRILRDMEEKPSGLEERIMKEDRHLSERMHIFNRLFHTMKDDFNRFLERIM
ncbi:MAG TPA: hypothetical protein VIU45_01385 [Chitinophagaceae bacterium]